MRIAFVSPEYPTELEGAGGIGTYVSRMAQALVAGGHTTEVFVPTAHEASSRLDGQITVHRVSWTQWAPSVSRVIPWLLQASALAAALERRQAEAPFDLVQSIDLNATGLFVRSRPGRPHLVFCSSAADLYNACDRRKSFAEPAREVLERSVLRRADVAYAPSRYIAEHFARAHGIDMQVLRPPALRGDASDAGVALPERFLLHFGQLIARKGTEMLAEALPLAWAEAPDLTMVWTGSRAKPTDWARWRGLWGERASQVWETGPLPRAQLYGVLSKAEASVLPSLVDNLPSTVIESLMFGVPVVGSRGASIDELVEEGVTGHLVDIGDVPALAAALVRVWRGESPVSRRFDWRYPSEMQPERFVSNLLALAR